MNSPHAETRKIAGRSSTLSKRILACQRCRDRKQKCDNALPRCSHCVHANKECVPQKGRRASQQ
ncbi:hypothetical protein GQ53DRAFT_804784, partial [Thozetella sp. PMI_491]